MKVLVYLALIVASWAVVYGFAHVLGFMAARLLTALGL